MTGAQLISAFELYVDDSTELSSAEELALVNKIYQKMCDDRPWEVLKKEASGTMSSTTQITLASDFGHFVENYNWTDNSVSTEINAKPTVVWINTTTPVQIVNWSDRKQYRNNASVCYLDLANSKIVFPYAQPSGATYSYDYKAVPSDLTTATSPVFPERFHYGIVHGMCVDDMVIQLFDKARSYAQENQAMYNDYLKRMALWNANLRND